MKNYVNEAVPTDEWQRLHPSNGMEVTSGRWLVSELVQRNRPYGINDSVS